MTTDTTVESSALAVQAENAMGFRFTAQGLSLDFASYVEDRLKFVSEDRTWIAFNGRCWDMANARTIAESLWDEYLAQRLETSRRLKGEDLTRELKAIAAIANAHSRNEALQLAQPKLAVSRDAFDRDAGHLLVTPTGTVNLKNGKLLANKPERMLTQCTSVGYVRDTPHPERFGELIEKLSGDDEETTLWLWRALGYTLTGSVHEDAVFYLRGPGGNGKSTLIKTVFEILGSYAAKLDIRVLASGSEYHATELAHLRGARFVVSSEIEKGMKLRESVLKDLSGGEVQTPRDIQQKAKDAARWTPTCKLFLYGNHDLSVRGTDDGIWRRLNKIVSSHKFERTGLRDELVDREGEAILSWMVRAAVEWHRVGLGEQPARVRAHTEEYRREQDILGQYFTECLVFEAGAFESSSALRLSYDQWCKDRGYDYQAGPKEFEGRLRERGCIESRSPKKQGQHRGWKGVQFKADLT